MLGSILSGKRDAMFPVAQEKEKKKETGCLWKCDIP